MKLSIPEPCHENWNEMSPAEKGRFCGSCQKEVVDFTQMTKEEITEFFIKKTSELTCGRFENKQIEAINLNEIKTKRIISKPWWIAVATFFILTNKGFSQTETVSVNKNIQVQTDLIRIKNSVETKASRSTVKEVEKDSNKTNFVTISGKLMEKDSNQPVYFANVFVEIDTNVIGISTDINGSFKLLIPRTKEDSIVLNVSYIGFEPLKIKLPMKDTNLGDIYLNLVELELHVIGGVMYEPKPLKRFYYRTKGFFWRLFH